MHKSVYNCAFNFPECTMMFDSMVCASALHKACTTFFRPPLNTAVR